MIKLLSGVVFAFVFPRIWNATVCPQTTRTLIEKTNLADPLRILVPKNVVAQEIVKHASDSQDKSRRQKTADIISITYGDNEEMNACVFVFVHNLILVFGQPLLIPIIAAEIDM